MLELVKKEDMAKGRKTNSLKHFIGIEVIIGYKKMKSFEKDIDFSEARYGLLIVRGYGQFLPKINEQIIVIDKKDGQKFVGVRDQTTYGTDRICRVGGYFKKYIQVPEIGNINNLAGTITKDIYNKYIKGDKLRLNFDLKNKKQVIIEYIKKNSAQIKKEPEVKKEEVEKDPEVEVKKEEVEKDPEVEVKKEEVEKEPEIDIKNIKKNIKDFYSSANEGLVDLCLKAVYENPNKINSVTKFVGYCNNLLQKERGYIHTSQSGSLKSTRIALENAGMIEWVGGFLSLTDKGKSLTWRQRKESEKRKKEEDFKKKNDIYNAERKYLKQKDIDYKWRQRKESEKRKKEEDFKKKNDIYNAERKYLKQKDIENKKEVREIKKETEVDRGDIEIPLEIKRTVIISNYGRKMQVYKVRRGDKIYIIFELEIFPSEERDELLISLHYIVEECRLSYPNVRFPDENITIKDIDNPKSKAVGVLNYSTHTPPRILQIKKFLRKYGLKSFNAEVGYERNGDRIRYYIDEENINNEIPIKILKVVDKEIIEKNKKMKNEKYNLFVKDLMQKDIEYRKSIKQGTKNEKYNLFVKDLMQKDIEYRKSIRQGTKTEDEEVPAIERLQKAIKLIRTGVNDLEKEKVELSNRVSDLEKEKVELSNKINDLEKEKGELSNKETEIKNIKSPKKSKIIKGKIDTNIGILGLKANLYEIISNLSKENKKCNGAILVNNFCRKGYSPYDIYSSLNIMEKENVIYKIVYIDWFVKEQYKEKDLDNTVNKLWIDIFNIIKNYSKEYNWKRGIKRSDLFAELLEKGYFEEEISCALDNMKKDGIITIKTYIYWFTTEYKGNYKEEEEDVDYVEEEALQFPDKTDISKPLDKENIQRLQKENKELVEAKIKDKENIQRLQKENKELVEAKIKDKENIQRLQKENKELKEIRPEKLVKENDVLKGDNIRLRSENDDVKKRINELDAIKPEKLEKENKELKDNKQKLEKEIHVLKVENLRLEGNLERAKKYRDWMIFWSTKEKYQQHKSRMADWEIVYFKTPRELFEFLRLNIKFENIDNYLTEILRKDAGKYESKR